MADKQTVVTLDPPPDVGLARVLELLEQQNERFARLEADNESLRSELAATQARTPAFRPMEQPASTKRRGGVWSTLNEELEGGPMRGWGEKQAIGISGGILIDVHGEKIPDRMLQQVGPRFVEGDRVRINPESSREGFAEGTTWGQILEKVASEAKPNQRTNPHGFGRVVKILWLTDDEGWKYKVAVQGITGAQPDGFHDRELLPA